jgi:hypothetical protein
LLTVLNERTNCIWGINTPHDPFSVYSTNIFCSSIVLSLGTNAEENIWPSRRGQRDDKNIKNDEKLGHVGV